MEVVSTFKHLYVLFDGTVNYEGLIAFVASVAHGNHSLESCIVQKISVGVGVFRNQIGGVVENVLVISFSLHLFFESRLEFLIGILLTDLMQEINDFL